MIGSLLRPELAELIAQRNFNQLREILISFAPPEIAEILADLTPKDQAILLRILPQKCAADVFEYLSVEDQENLLHALGNEEVAAILNELRPDDRTALLEELPAGATQKLLNLLSPTEKKIAVQLLGYPEKSVGRLMTPDFIAVRDDWTIKEVLDHVRENGRDSETLNVVYVIDDTGKLIDDVRIREFLLRPLDLKVREVRDENFVALKVTDSEETAVAVFKKYDRTALPVVDSAGRLLGIVTVDDILDVVEKENTEDIQKMGGMEALDAPYLQIGLFSMVKKRAGWLSVLFVGEMLTTSAMNHFEGELAHAIVLAAFIPLIISSGGNSGSQATSLIIRAMAIRDVSLRDWWRVLSRELLAGVLLGGVLGGLGMIRILIWHFLGWKNYGIHFLLIASTIGCSLIGVVLFGSVTGSMLPFILRRLGFDPAVSSAPFVATLVDVTGLIIYFTIAYSILHGTLL
ncbi:MAG: magnesium transporter [Verrucomicrobiota bacterium]|nr:magnesium transporter [Verrucomicrobiota bacterium]